MALRRDDEEEEPVGAAAQSAWDDDTEDSAAPLEGSVLAADDVPDWARVNAATDFDRFRPVKDQMDNLRDFGANLAGNAKQTSPIEELVQGGGTISWGPKGINIQGLHPDYVQGLMQSQAKLKEIMGSFEQESQRLKSKEAQLQTPGGKIGNALSILASNLGRQKDMPGWVQGLAQTSRDLNPTLDETINRRLGVEHNIAGMAEQQERLSGTMLRADELMETRRQTQLLRAQEARDRMERARLDREQKADKLRVDARDRASKAIQRSGGKWSPKDYPNLTPEDIKDLQDEAKAVKSRVSEQDSLKRGIAKAHDDTKKSIAEAKNTLTKEMATMKDLSPTTAENFIQRASESITKAETHLDDMKTKIETMPFATPESKAKAVQDYEAARKDLEVMRKLRDNKIKEYQSEEERRKKLGLRPGVDMSRAFNRDAANAPAAAGVNDDELKALGVVSIKSK